uniref:Ig-like domain-containing protein n=1 Tax=Mesocestoides corti TaxID=53468 RepID=A0A5K3FTK6_MESCO
MPPSFGFTLALVGFLISNSLANIDPDVKIRIIPTIVSIPPPVTYLDKSRVSRQESLLTCKVWPPNANLSILSARPQFLSSPQLPFNLGPVPPDSFAVQEAVVADDPEAARPEPSPFSSVVAQLMVSDTSDVWHVDYMDLHCKAATQFGTVVSAPFRVVHARLDDFSMLEGHAVPSDYTNTQVREFIKGNMAFVTCPLPPDSQPPPTVQFYINGSLVNNTQKYKQVRRPNENSVLLLINSFKTSDEGDYRCSLTNPVTGRTVWSPMIVRLQIRVPDKPVPVRLLLPLVSQDNSSALQSRQIVVREGDNVTLLCIMEGAPPPEVRTYPHNQQSGRYIFDEQFGM